MFGTRKTIAKLQDQGEYLMKQVEILTERIAAAETKLEQRYISDTTREANNANDARDILAEYLFGAQPEAKKCKT